MKKALITAGIFVAVFALVYYMATGGFTRLRLQFFPQKATSQQLMDELSVRHFGLSPFWLARFDARVSKESDLLSDSDEDGLTLEQEYFYNTNPFDEDTDRDGYTDGQEVANQYSPTGNGRLDANQNGLPDTWEEEMGLDPLAEFDDDFDEDDLSNVNEFRYGTDPTNPDTDGDGFDDGTEVKNGYDPAAPGDARPTVQIVIDKIGVDAPVILSKSAEEVDLQKDLETGVILYPGMAIPGQRGNAYIAGHSSNYVWSRGQYNDIFKDLVGLSSEDKIVVKEILTSGKVVSHTYTVTLQEEVAADDIAIFEVASNPVLTLTTCWPLGTRQRRIMVKAVLDSDSEKEIYAEDRVREGK